MFSILKYSAYPIGSMYAIYGDIYHPYSPNLSIYTIHGSYGYGWFPEWIPLSVINWDYLGLQGIMDGIIDGIMDGYMGSGWWLTYPSEKYDFVSWDYDIPNIWKKTC